MTAEAAEVVAQPVPKARFFQATSGVNYYQANKMPYLAANLDPFRLTPRYQTAKAEKEAINLSKMKSSGNFEMNKLATDIEALNIRNGFNRDIGSFASLTEGFKGEPRTALVDVFSKLGSTLQVLNAHSK